jgi:hypothetical protein
MMPNTGTCPLTSVPNQECTETRTLFQTSVPNQECTETRTLFQTLQPHEFQQDHSPHHRSFGPQNNNKKESQFQQAYQYLCAHTVLDKSSTPFQMKMENSLYFNAKHTQPTMTQRCGAMPSEQIKYVLNKNKLKKKST